MVYDFEFREAGHLPLYRTPTQPPSSSAPPPPSYGQRMYPRVGSQHGAAVAPPPAGRPYGAHPPPPSSTGLGIRVTVKPEYRINPPPQMSPHVGEIPRSNFHFDFDFERKILAEAEKENPNWGKLAMENQPLRTAQPITPQGPVGDPVVSKYIAMGLNREAVSIAVAKYGDDPNKVKGFVNGYTALREMGFSSSTVAEALFMNNNDTNKALAHCLS
ncbi:metacaspase-1B-like [Punica granatum]|uniref:Metacaspase-1B-like n=2 Tax=Punica granatum TaxID=22663 RepID=A0A6P8DDG0_PUNGR|nr:metacaspase-1B-like [Punica granatum]PKI63465.1 hypothetical protein CRG98_016132 [Punica granatum]